jgi:hypothetical protein
MTYDNLGVETCFHRTNEEARDCETCHKEQGYRMFDIDGTNLVEKLVCTNTDCPDYER